MPLSTSSGKPAGRLHSVGQVSRVMSAYYAAFRDSDGPVAWCSSVGPVELLYAFGFKVFFPENHAAMIAVRRQAKAYVKSAHALGFSPNICGYLRADIGACLSEQSPLSEIRSDLTTPPRPDIIVYSTNQCRDIKEWFLWHANRFGVPCVGVESPTNVDAVTHSVIDAVSRQMQDLVFPLEQAAKCPFDIDRLREIVRRSKTCSDLWRQILEMNCSRPAPLSFDAALTLMGPAVVLRGTRAAIDVYKIVLSELEQRRTAEIGAQKREYYRVYFDGMPVWGKLREIDRVQKRLGIAQVASTYCSSWIFDALDSAKPFDTMAEAYTALFIVRSEQAKLEYIRQMATRYHIDGFLFHEAKTCPNNSNSRYGLPSRLRDTLNRPVATIYGDHVDETFFDSERFVTQIEGFTGQLAQRG